MERSPRQLAAIWITALPIGAVVFWLTCFVKPAEHATLNFGTEYAQMAVDPFGLIGKFPHRILAPLVAHVLGFAGDRYWLFAHGCTVLMIAMTFAAAMLLGARWHHALLVTLAIAFTGTVQIYKGHVGYPDPITWTLMTATIVARRHPIMFWSLQFLNVMHHEQILFFWPWLVWWRHRDDWRRWRAWLPDVLGGAMVVAIYYAWRAWVHDHATQQMLTLEHYESLKYFPIGTLGLTALNLLSTYIWFGALPVLVAWHAFVDGWRREGWGILLYLVSLHAVFGVAHDVYRFTCFLFVPVLLAGLRLCRERHGASIFALIGILSGFAVEAQGKVFADVGTAVLVEQTANGPAVRAEPVMSIVPEVIPAFAWTFLAYFLALLATITIGWYWAKGTNRPADAAANADA